MVSILLLVKLDGKKRLSHMYSEEQRKNLVLFLFERMLSVLKGFPVYVASPSNLPADDYVAVEDEWEDINRVITKARAIVKDDTLVLPCDLPFIQREDVTVLCGGEIKIVPSQNGGTNAFFLPENVEFETQFGDNSFCKHVQLLDRNGLLYEIVESDNYRDIDVEEDIAWALKYRRDSEFSHFVKNL